MKEIHNLKVRPEYEQFVLDLVRVLNTNKFYRVKCVEVAPEEEEQFTEGKIYNFIPALCFSSTPAIVRIGYELYDDQDGEEGPPWFFKGPALLEELESFVYSQFEEVPLADSP